MFSIIICSISPERLIQVKKNIQDTIGTEHEFIALDNRETRWPIAKVYNEGARRAHYPYLFFVHEDVRFHSKDWGKVIADKLKEPDCGAIGFAGNKVKLKAYSGWPQVPEFGCSFLYQKEPQKTNFAVFNVHLEHPFEEVVCLDGLGIFVCKALWEKYPFDEKMLTGFHCYDLDFSMQIARTGKYKNYVCTTPAVLIEHFSLGNLDRVWIQETIRLHKEKWNAFLPLKTFDVELDRKTEKRMDEKYFHVFVKRLLRSDYPDKWKILSEFLVHSFSWKHLGHCCSDLNAFLKRRKYTVGRNRKVIASSRWFDAAWYVSQYPEASGMDPALHYLEKGWKAGYNPSLEFSTGAYLTMNPDVCVSGMNPLLHYELKGRRKKRARYTLAEAAGWKLQAEDATDVEKLRETGQRPILLISHELTLTGAPRALLHMAIKLKEKGFVPVVLSLKEGPMEAELKALGIPLFTMPLLYAQLRFKEEPALRFLAAFDTVLFNTLATLQLAAFLPPTPARKILWLHEGTTAYANYGRYLELPMLFERFDHIYAVGKYAESFATRYVAGKQKLDILLYGLPDESRPTDPMPTGEKVQFLLAGTISRRKGHKVLLRTLPYLPQEVRDRITIYVAGAPVERRTAKKLKRLRHSCIQYLGEVPHDKLLDFYRKADAILCPSLDDPMPIVCTEGMMFSKPVITSDHTGTASFIENGRNGFVIPADDPKALADAICQAVSRRNELPEIGKAARRIYDAYFTMEQFEQKLDAIFPGC